MPKSCSGNGFTHVVIQVCGQADIAMPLDVAAMFEGSPEPTLYIPPALETYHVFHETLNCFTWLLKARYATRDALKAKRFQLDHLWQGYLEQQVRSLACARRGFGSTAADVPAAEAALRKVWYNELAYASPQMTDPLLLDARGVARNMESAADRHVFASWRIAEAYYTVYFALQSVLDLRGARYRRARHDATHSAFKHSTVDALRGSLFGFPFDLASQEAGADWTLKMLPPSVQYLRHGYASHPRYRGTRDDGSFESTARRVLRHLSKNAQSTEAETRTDKVMLPDFLKAMRVWANYTDINTLIALREGGFRAYLDQDLHVVTFFYAGIAEVGALAVLGVERTVELATAFVAAFINQHSQIATAPAPHNIEVRFQLYQHLGWLTGVGWSPPSAPLAHTPPALLPVGLGQ